VQDDVVGEAQPNGVPFGDIQLETEH
jgi:hypothetical protein